MSFIRQGIKIWANNITHDHTARIYHITFMSPVFMGIGLSWATYTGNYHHYPLCVLCPSVYVGYQVFSNRDMIGRWFKKYR